MLEVFGLDSHAEEIYGAMLACPGASVAELSDRLALPEAEIRAALDELARRCLLRASWHDPTVLRPVRPDIALEALVDREQAELGRRRKRLEEGRAVIAAIVAEYARHQKLAVRGECGERLDGVDAVRERIEQLAWGVRHELLSVMGERGDPPPGMEANRSLEAMLIERGVGMRSLHLESGMTDERMAGYTRWLTEQGGQVRTCPTLPPRMLVFDRTHVMLPANPDEPVPAVVLVTAHGMVAALADFYELLWQTAKPFGAPRHSGSDELTKQQRQLLRLLYDGNTDSAIARRLGVSVRTVRRMTAELMHETGARSRFQLGSRAYERGWLRFGD